MADPHFVDMTEPDDIADAFEALDVFRVERAPEGGILVGPNPFWHVTVEDVFVGRALGFTCGYRLRPDVSDSAALEFCAAVNASIPMLRCTLENGSLIFGCYVVPDWRVSIPVLHQCLHRLNDSMSAMNSLSPNNLIDCSRSLWFATRVDDPARRDRKLPEGPIPEPRDLAGLRHALSEGEDLLTDLSNENGLRVHQEGDSPSSVLLVSNGDIVRFQVGFAANGDLPRERRFEILNSLNRASKIKVVSRQNEIWFQWDVPQETLVRDDDVVACFSFMYDEGYGVAEGEESGLIDYSTPLIPAIDS